MPLVVLTGLPCSGKTRRATEIADHLRSKGCDVHIVNMESVHMDGIRAYHVSQEKNTRACLRAVVDRLLTGDRVVIVDSLNFVKGFRYELYCLARAAATRHCVVHCDTTAECAWEWNENRTQGCYDHEGFWDLARRYERPDANNRWDAPLFTIHTGDDEETPLDLISQAVLEGKTLAPTRATVSQRPVNVNYTYDMDQVTQEIVTALVEAVKMGRLGEVTVPRSTTKVRLARPVTLPELRRLRSQFTHMVKVQAGARSGPPDVGQVGTMFVDYVNATL